MEHFDDAVIIRTSARAFDDGLLARLPRGAADARQDFIAWPTYVPDLAHATLTLLVDGAEGIWHVANAGAMIEAELLRRLASAGGLDAARAWRAAGPVEDAIERLARRAARALRRRAA